MRVLFQCNTVYQIIVAIQIKNNFFKNDVCDIIISDILNGSVKIKNRIEQIHFFNKVYIQKIKNHKISLFKQIFSSLLKNKIVNIGINMSKIDCYDIFLLSNPLFQNLVLIEKLKKKNKFINLYFFEDGLSTYTKLYERLYSPCTKNIKNRINKKYLINDVNKIFTFVPDLFDWNPTQQIVKIPKPSINDNKLKDILNHIFDYQNIILPKNCKAVFLEEGYYGDGKKVNDIEIIKEFKKIYQESIYVKRHPRNRINRFISEGIAVLETDSCPWELFVLNEPLIIEKLTLISIASAALFTPTILFDLKPKCIFCLNLINDKKNLYEFIPDLECKIASYYNNFIILENISKIRIKK